MKTPANRMSLHTLALGASLLAAGCGLPPASGEPEGTAEQNATGVIFPDDPATGPGDSCHTGAPLTCPHNFSLLYPGPGHVTVATKQHTPSVLDAVGQNLTVALGGNATASIGASTMACYRSGTFAVSGTSPPMATFNATAFTDPYLMFEETLNFGSTFIEDRASGGIQFIGPTRLGLTGIYCARSGGTPGAGIGILTEAGFGSRQVSLVDSYDHYAYNATTGKVGVYCKWYLRSDQAFVARARPNDVIGASGDHFVRGYALTGNARTQACSNIANQQCLANGLGSSGQATEGIDLCISTSINACVASFAKADPCNPVCARTCSSTANCATHQTCSAGCCIANPF